MCLLKNALLKSLIFFLLAGIILIPVYTVISGNSKIIPVNDKSESAKGFPKISLQLGFMRVISGQTIDGQLKELIHGNDPISRTPVKICSIQGHLRETQGNDGILHLALINKLTGTGLIPHPFS